MISVLSRIPSSFNVLVEIKLLCADGFLANDTG